MRNVLTTWAAAALLAGCATYTVPMVSVGPMTDAERNFEAVWRAARTVLREHYFQIDRQDRRAGILATAPLLARQPLEFWRRDASTKYDLLEGALHNIYRVARVSIRPAAGAESFRPEVRVRLYRSNRRSPYGEVHRGPTGLGRSSRRQEDPFAPEQVEDLEEGFPEQPDREPSEPATASGPVADYMPAWMTPLGRDRKLEEKLRNAIVARTGLAGR